MKVPVMYADETCGFIEEGELQGLIERSAIIMFLRSDGECVQVGGDCTDGGGAKVGSGPGGGALPKVLSALLIVLALAFSGRDCLAVSDSLYSGVSFSDGAVSCQSGYQFRCSDGVWEALDLACTNRPPQPTVANPADCRCTEEELKTCDQAGKSCCIWLEAGQCSKGCCEKR